MIITSGNHPGNHPHFDAELYAGVNTLVSGSEAEESKTLKYLPLLPVTGADA